MGILSASPVQVSGEGDRTSSAKSVKEFRSVLAVVGFALWFVALVPPIALWARRYEYVEALQFCSFSVLTPALLVTGAPWRRLGLASSEPYRVSADGEVVSPARPRLMDRAAMSRSASRSHFRAVSLGMLAAGLVILWRSAPAVDFLVRHPWMVGVESASLVLAGILFWLELVESPPVSPSSTRPYRIGLAAVSMWVVWIVAYANGLSRDSWYNAFHHVAGHGVSVSADQQLTSGVMWLLSAVSFLPIVFWNLIHWLQSEEDPDDELYRLVRDERSRGNFDTNL